MAVDSKLVEMFWLDRTWMWISFSTISTVWRTNHHQECLHLDGLATLGSLPTIRRLFGYLLQRVSTRRERNLRNGQHWKPNAKGKRKSTFFKKLTTINRELPGEVRLFLSLSHSPFPFYFVFSIHVVLEFSFNFKFKTRRISTNPEDSFQRPGECSEAPATLML